MNDDSKKFYVFLSRLMDLAAIFERQRLNRQALETFRQRPDVRNIVAGLSDLFRDDASDPAAATDADATTPAETA